MEKEKQESPIYSFLRGIFAGSGSDAITQPFSMFNLLIVHGVYYYYYFVLEVIEELLSMSMTSGRKQVTNHQ